MKIIRTPEKIIVVGQGGDSFQRIHDAALVLVTLASIPVEVQEENGVVSVRADFLKKAVWKDQP